MTSELTLGAKVVAGTAETVLYGLYTTNATHMTDPNWSCKAWEIVSNPGNVFSITSGQNLIATNGTGFHDMTLEFNPTLPGSYTGVVRIATTDPNDWYPGIGGKLQNTGAVFERYVITASAPGELRISVNDINITEQDLGTTTNAIFTISLSSTAPTNVTVSYATEAGTADAGVDYTHTTGTATITAGQLSTTVAVPVIGDNELEQPDQVFYLRLSNPLPAGQSIDFSANNPGECTINDDDSPFPDGTFFRFK